MKRRALALLMLVNMAICASCTTVPESPEAQRAKINLEMLIQRLEAAADAWTIEDVERALVAKFPKSEGYYSPWPIIERLVYAKGLVVEEAKYNFRYPNKMVLLSLTLDRKTGCFTREEIGDLYHLNSVAKFIIRDFMPRIQIRIEHDNYIETIEQIYEYNSTDMEEVDIRPAYVTDRPWGRIRFDFFVDMDKHLNCLDKILFETEKRE
jgi:hypothetical protein